MRKIYIIFIILVFCILSLCCLKLFIAPFIWIGAILFSILFCVSLSIKSSATKTIVYNMSFVIFALTIFECYIFYQDTSMNYTYKGTYRSPDYIQYDDILGYCPQKNKKVISAKYFKNKCLYDVEYTIDSNGLRISSPLVSSSTVAAAADDDDTQCILFFGGSFTFGEGVHDYESLPYQVAKKAIKQKFNVYNFSFHGYGPHQMLSALEHGLVAQIVECSNKTVIIYQAIKDHIFRAQGLRQWDKHGPAYELDKDGHLIFSGHFDDNYLLPIRVIRQLEKSYTYQKLYSKQNKITQKSLELFIEIIKQSKMCAKKILLDIKFHVIFWDNVYCEPSLIKMLEQLEKNGIFIHFITNIITDVNTNKWNYFITDDGHPNSKAYSIISKYIYDEIL